MIASAAVCEEGIMISRVSVFRSRVILSSLAWVLRECRISAINNYVKRVQFSV
jgi:hypothetical protein